MPNYTRLLATAQRLISNAGRTITFVQFAITDDDAAKPWRGAFSPRAVPTATLSAKAVAVEPGTDIHLGEWGIVEDLTKRVTKYFIVAGTPTLDQFNEIIDSDSTRWKIEFTHKLQPGAVSLVYFIGVRR